MVGYGVGLSNSHVRLCPEAFGVKDKACGIPLAGDYDGYPSFKKQVS